MKRLIVLAVMIVVMGTTKAEAYYGFMDHYFGRGFGGYGYGGYGYYGYDRTAGRAAVAIAGAVEVVKTVSDVQVQDRGMRVIEKEQEFQHQQAYWNQQIQQNQAISVRVLEQKVSKLETENAELKKQNAELKNKLDEMQKKLDKLAKARN